MQKEILNTAGIKCIKCHKEGLNVVGVFIRKVHGAYREFTTYLCGFCGSRWSEAGAVVDKKQWLAEEEARYQSFKKKLKAKLLKIKKQNAKQNVNG